MQHYSRLLRRQADERQWHFAIPTVALWIQGQRNVPADHPELNTFVITFRQVLIDHFANRADRGAAIRRKCSKVVGYGRSCHAREGTRSLPHDSMWNA